MLESNPADEHIVDAIENMTDEINRRIRRDQYDLIPMLVDNVAKLRASMNPTVVVPED